MLSICKSQLQKKELLSKELKPLFDEETEILDAISAFIESDKLLICSSLLDLCFSDVSTISLNDDSCCAN